MTCTGGPVLLVGPYAIEAATDRSRSQGMVPAPCRRGTPAITRSDFDGGHAWLQAVFPDELHSEAALAPQEDPT